MGPEMLLPFAGQIMQTMGGQNAQMQQNRANQMLSQQEFAQNLAMWNKQNEYNLPQNQMARLKAAGLNPNLVYGNGSVTGNTVGAPPRYNAPQQEYRNYTPDFPSALAQYQDFKLKKAQIDNVEAIASVNKSNAIMKGIDAYMYNEEGAGPQIWQGKMYEANEMWKRAPAKTSILESQATAEQIRAKYAEDLVNMKLRQAGVAIEGGLLQNVLRHKSVNWYTADKIAKMVGIGLGGLGISKMMQNVGKKAPVFNKYQNVYNEK